MKEKAIESHSAKCPYYVRETSLSLLCDASDADGIKSMKLVFNTSDKAADWRKKYCNSIIGCTTCPIHIKLTEYAKR